MLVRVETSRSLQGDRLSTYRPASGVFRRRSDRMVSSAIRILRGVQRAEGLEIGIR